MWETAFFVRKSFFFGSVHFYQFFFGDLAGRGFRQLSELTEFARDFVKRQVLLQVFFQRPHIYGLAVLHAVIAAACLAAQPVVEPTRTVLRPAAVDDSGFTVEPDRELPGGFVVRGARAR